MDPLGSIGSITNLVLLIWDKAEAAKQCKDDCKALASLAKLIQQTILDLQTKLQHPLVQNLLTEIRAALREAEKLVSKCSKMSRAAMFWWSATLDHEFQLVVTKLNNKLFIIPLIQMSVSEGHQGEIMRKLAAIESELRNGAAAAASDLKVSKMARVLKRVATSRRFGNHAEFEAAVEISLGPTERLGNQDAHSNMVHHALQDMERMEQARKRQLQELQEQFKASVNQLLHPTLISDEFKCPISLELMKDPVMLHETGFVFDRKNLEHWFSVNEVKTCPITRKVLQDARYTTVLPLKNWIDSIRERMNDILEEEEEEEALNCSNRSFTPTALPPKSYAPDTAMQKLSEAPFLPDPAYPPAHSADTWPSSIPSPFKTRHDTSRYDAAPSAPLLSQTAVFAAEMPTTPDKSHTMYASPVLTAGLVASTSGISDYTDQEDDCGPSAHGCKHPTSCSTPGQGGHTERASMQLQPGCAVGRSPPSEPHTATGTSSTVSGTRAGASSNIPEPAGRTGSWVPEPAARWCPGEYRSAERATSLTTIPVRAGTSQRLRSFGYQATSCTIIEDPLD